MEKFKIGKVDDWGKNQFALKGGAMGHWCSEETGEIKPRSLAFRINGAKAVNGMKLSSVDHI